MEPAAGGDDDRRAQRQLCQARPRLLGCRRVLAGRGCRRRCRYPPTARRGRPHSACTLGRTWGRRSSPCTRPSLGRGCSSVDTSRPSPAQRSACTVMCWWSAGAKPGADLLLAALSPDHSTISPGVERSTIWRTPRNCSAGVLGVTACLSFVVPAGSLCCAPCRESDRADLSCPTPLPRPSRSVRSADAMASANIHASCHLLTVMSLELGP